MTRFRRTAALIAATTLALGISACHPPSENDSDLPAPTDVTPDAGYEGAGEPTSSPETTETEGATDGTGDGEIQGEDGEPGTISDSEPYAPGISSPLE